MCHTLEGCWEFSPFPGMQSLSPPDSLLCFKAEIVRKSLKVNIFHFSIKHTGETFVSILHVSAAVLLVPALSRQKHKDKSVTTGTL